MGDQQRGAPMQETSNSFLNLVLGGAVNGAGRIIQDENTRVGEQGTRNGDSLPWFCMKRDIFQYGRSAIAKGNMLEHDIATHNLIVTALILIQFGLLF